MGHIKEYLGKSKVIQTSERLKNELNKDVDMDEALVATDAVHNNKSRGPDSLQRSFTKKLKAELCPMFKDLVGSVIQTKKSTTNED